VSWQELAWWMHDHLDYSEIYFFPKLAAFNIQWREHPERRILSYIQPKGVLLGPEQAGAPGLNADKYQTIKQLVNKGRHE
jgi:hypothetical protein